MYVPTRLHPFLAFVRVADPRAAALTGATLARSVLHLVMPDDAPVALRAIEATEQWARGETGASDAFRASHLPRAARERLERAGGAARSAMLAAVAACSVAATGFDVANHVVRARIAVEIGSDEEPDHRAVGLLRADLLEVAKGVRWPMTQPSRYQIGAAPTHIREAWSQVGDEGGELTTGQLIEAYQLAQRIGLRWDRPVERALAERAAAEEPA